MLAEDFALKADPASATHAAFYRNLRVSRSECPRPPRMTPDPFRSRRTIPALPDRRPRKAAAAMLTRTAMPVVKATQISPTTPIWSAMLPVAGLMNCGTSARRKTAVLGLVASTVTPWRNALQPPAVTTAGSSSGADAADRYVCTPSQIR